ncbi:hypothetical protein [Siminovitchia fortis]|uniref:hypothetical protein n=1 Tax=Siminovitchia fortis TaxID=254758 RepID=UPI0011A3D19B|nr:hypothetical protein [Siminovitchia fortis]
MKAILDEAAAVREAKLRVQEAREKAIQDEKEETARRLLKMKTVVPSVAGITRVTKKQVIEIQKEM